MTGDSPGALQTELLHEIRGWAPLLGELSPETPLMESGAFDSLAMLNLVTWIEDRLGDTVDVTAKDPAREWNTVSALVRFVERLRPGS